MRTPLIVCLALFLVPTDGSSNTQALPGVDPFVAILKVRRSEVLPMFPILSMVVTNASPSTAPLRYVIEDGREAVRVFVAPIDGSPALPNIRQGLNTSERMIILAPGDSISFWLPLGIPDNRDALRAGEYQVRALLLRPHAAPLITGSVIIRIPTCYRTDCVGQIPQVPRQ